MVSFITSIIREEIRASMREIVREEMKEAASGQQPSWTGFDGIKSGCSAVFGGMSTLAKTSSTALSSVCAPVVGGLTGREKIALISVGAYTCYKFWPKIKDAFPARKIKTVLNLSTPLGSREYIHESVRDGSPELKLSAPRCQVAVGFYTEGVYKVHGNAIRLEDYLLVPDHVLQQEEAAHVRLSNGKFYDLKKAEEMLVVETDVIAIKVSPTVMSQLGVQKVVLQHEHSEHGIGVSVIGAQSLGTTGILTPGSFGRVIYSGTTRGGYSGAAYMQGSRIVGIHMHGGKVNGGFSISYLWCCLKYELDQVDESSEEFLQGIYKSGTSVDVDPAWHDLDTKRFRSKGRYHIVTIDAWEKVFKTDPRPRVVTYDDYAQEFEALGFRNRMASNIKKPGLGEVTSDHQDIMNVLRNSSVKKLQAIAKCLNGLQTKEITTGQPEIQQRNSQASCSTQIVI